MRHKTDPRLDGIPRADSIYCPNCGTESCDAESYKVNKIKYPQYFNHGSGFNGNNNYSCWDELHCCKKCKKEFQIENGSDT